MGIHDGHRERMRERFLGDGLEHFAPHEALELLLQYAIPQKDTNPIAHALMDRYGSLSGVLTASVEDLQNVKGVGAYTAVLLSLVPKLCNKANLADAMRQDMILDSSDLVGQFLLARLAGEKNEVLYQLCLDSQKRLLSCRKLEEGTVNRSHLHVRRLVENAILDSAVFVILAHNHPGGDVTPSPEDIGATELVGNALASIDVVLMDHFIVGRGIYTSFHELGLGRHLC